MACADEVTAKAKAAKAINLIISFLPCFKSHCGGWQKAPWKQAFKSLSPLWGLASGCWLGRLTSFRRLRIGVLGYAIVDELTSLQEVDRRVLLGGLSFA